MKAAQVLCEGTQVLLKAPLHSINASHIFGDPCNKLLAKTNPDKYIPYRTHC